MKKLIIVSLVLAMLVVFSGVANAQYWWKSQEITSSIKVTYQNFSKGNTLIGTENGEFTGYMVANSTTAAQGAALERVFLCGTFTVGGETLDVWLDFSGEAAFSTLSTDHSAEPSGVKTDKETADVIAVGTFTDQTPTHGNVSGPAYLNGTLTLIEGTADNIESVTVKGTTVGGYGQGVNYFGTFSSPSISAVLEPYTSTTPLTCVGGVVKPLT